MRMIFRTPYASKTIYSSVNIRCLEINVGEETLENKYSGKFLNIFNIYFNIHVKKCEKLQKI